jgi:hypothetical protein
MKNRIYILLDQSLSNQQKVVQAAHLSLEVIREYLAKKRIDSVDFYEPLLEAVTGIATVPLTPADGKFLQHLPMLKSRDFLGEC